MTALLKPRMPFVKVYMSLMESSSLMQEPCATRWLFVWFLGRADADSYVPRHTLFNLARMANVTEAEAAEGLRALMAPDPQSRSPAEDGRRLIELPDGGWRVVNAQKYREFRSPKQVYDAARQAKFREKKAKRRKPSSAKTRPERSVETFDYITGTRENP